MSVFTVFCVGTGHSFGGSTNINDPNSTIVNLYHQCTGHRRINGGPNGVFGIMQGLGMDPLTRDSVKAILAARPSRVNLTGHSRGAVTCHMIANELMNSTDAAAAAIQEINLVVLDPVNMSVHVKRGKQLKNPHKLGKYVSIVMENVNKAIFPTTTLKSANPGYNDRLKFLHMPGTHGSGTQQFTSGIGLACHGTILRYLHKWGSPFRNVPTDAQLCDAFARIHVENPVKYNLQTGLISDRRISDEASGKVTSATAHSIKHAWQQIDPKRTAAINNNFQRMAAAGKAKIDYRNTPYFFNEYHASKFNKAFPALSARFSGDFTNQQSVETELTRIEAEHKYIVPSLMQLGML